MAEMQDKQNNGISQQQNPNKRVGIQLIINSNRAEVMRIKDKVLHTK